MYKCLVSVFLFGLIFNAFALVKINQLIGTDTALYGNNNSLTCTYVLEDETGVEIKWFYNDDTQIVSWVIDRGRPQAMGAFRNILDFEEDSSENGTTHSTIYFKDLTFNLTGKYTCKVSGDIDEKSEAKNMVVYQPASSVTFFPDETEDTLICSASDLYPKPTIEIFGKYISGSTEAVPIIDGDLYLNTTEDKFYNITKSISFDRDALNSSVEFICRVFIAETSYQENSSITVIVEGIETTTETSEYFDKTTISNVSTTISATPNAIKEVNFAEVSSLPSTWLLTLAAGILSWRCRNM